MMTRRSLLPFALAALAALPAGCTALLRTNGAGGGGEGGGYHGPECANFHWFELSNRTPDLSPAESAVRLTCADKTGGNGAMSYQAIEADHRGFDDRKFDHLRASVMVLDCALNPDCSVDVSRDILGMMAGYARRLDPQAAGAALHATGASDGLTSAFVAKVSAARDVIATRVKLLDPRRKQIWVDIPEQVWTEREQYFTKWRTLYTMLDEALAKGTDPARAAHDIQGLRQRYLEACRVEGCLFTPFVLETTRALTLLAVQRRDVATALAEDALLADDRLASQYFSRAMLTALLPATKREAEAWEKYDRAKSSGADPAALQAMFGDTPPIQISPDGPAIVWGYRPMPDLTSALDRDGVVSAGGNVRSVQRRGDDATITFADIVTTYDDADCHETNKIDGIDRDGHIIYRQVCSNYRTHTERTKVDPITVPFDDARALRPGDSVLAWVGKDRRGALANASQQRRYVQIRGHRLHASEAMPDRGR